MYSNFNQNGVLELEIQTSKINKALNTKLIEVQEKQEDVLFGRGKCRSCNCQGFSAGWGDNCDSCGHPYSHHENR